MTTGRYSIATAIALALCATISSVRAQTITSFTLQDNSQAAFETGFEKKTIWKHLVTEKSHTATTAHGRFGSYIHLDIEGTTSSTTGAATHLTATIAISDPFQCGWTLRLSDRRLGAFYIDPDPGSSHAELHAVNVGWSTGPTSGSLNLPEVDSGSHGGMFSDPFNIKFDQSLSATLDGVGSKTVTLTFDWDTFASG